MASRMIGIEIRSGGLRIVQVRGGMVTAAASARVPQGLVADGRVTDPAAMVSLIRDTMAARGIRGRDCALVLPSGIVTARQLTLPVMGRAELQLNLPFEFRDILPGALTDYDFDHIILSVDESRMTLYAAAVPRGAVEAYRQLLKQAGLTLKAAVPAEMAWRNLIRSRPDLPDKLCVLDAGQNDLRIHIFSGGEFVMGKAIPCGDDAAPENLRRTLNFYNFSLPPGEAPLTDLILWGQEDAARPLLAGLSHLSVHPGDLLPGGAAAGACLQKEPTPSRSSRAAVSADKQAMNLARCRKEFDAGKMLPLVLLLTAALLIFAKLGILDPLRQKAAAYNALSAQQEQLAQANTRLLEYDTLARDYLRFGDASMTEAEKSLVSRAEVLELVASVIGPRALIDNFTVNGNVLTVNLSGITLEDAGILVADLEACDPVQQAGILSATADDGKQARLLLSITLTGTGTEEGDGND